MALYWWEDIGDVAIQLQAARLCDDIDRDILEQLYKN